MGVEITGGVFLGLAVVSLAASLVFLLGAGGRRDAPSLLVGLGFALLAGCFAWLWGG